MLSQLGEGTLIRVLLPELEMLEGQQSPMQKQRQISEDEPNTVLLVDDEEAVRSVTRSMLMRLGYEVVTANDGIEAVEAFRLNREQIVLVLLDLKMPRRGGEEVFTQLRDLQQDIRVILCSGYAEQDATQAFSGRDLNGFLQKPYSFVQLQDIVNDVLERDAEN